MDFATLMRIVLPGLREKVERSKAHAMRTGGDPLLLEGMLMALQLLAEICLRYATQARALAARAEDERREAELLQMAFILERITQSAPQSLQERIQLYWLYAWLIMIWAKIKVCAWGKLTRWKVCQRRVNLTSKAG